MFHSVKQCMTDACLSFAIHVRVFPQTLEHYSGESSARPNVEGASDHAARQWTGRSQSLTKRTFSSSHAAPNHLILARGKWGDQGPTPVSNPGGVCGLARLLGQFRKMYLASNKNQFCVRGRAHPLGPGTGSRGGVMKHPYCGSLL